MGLELGFEAERVGDVNDRSPEATARKRREDGRGRRRSARERGATTRFATSSSTTSG